MTHYEGLLLDFGGVVTTDFFAALGAHCERLGLSHESFRNLVTADPNGRELYHQVERGELSQPAFEQKIAQLLGVQPAGLIQGLLADLRPEPLMAEAVARARTAGIRVGVITNSWGTAPYDPYAAYQLDQRFDAVVISSQVGLRKPEPAICRLAADELAVPLGASCSLMTSPPTFSQPKSWAWPSSIMSIRAEQFTTWSVCLASQIASCVGHDGC
jgi:putative hydrolase of the HAD superfamily